MVQKVEKRRKTDLTGSRKKRAREKESRPEPSDLAGARAAYDRAIGFLLHIKTLAGLLEVHGWRRDAGELDARMVSGAGGMIFDEAERLRAALETIHRKSLSHATHP
jgi:hypothetical protein